MGAGHIHGPGGRHGENTKRLTLVLALVTIYMIAEVVGGLLTNSLALLADAGHMLSDAAALALSLFAISFAHRPAPPQKTYGYYRIEILAALANGAALVAISIYIFIEAYQRFHAPPEILGGPMMAIATGGLAINLLGLWILHKGRSTSLNLRGAWLHVLADMMGSVGAMTAGALILVFGWNWADPVASILIGLLVLYSSWSLLREAVSVLMEGAPGHLDIDEVRNAIRSVDGVQSVHDLHIWTITSGMVALSVHAVTEDSQARGQLLHEIQELLHDRFHIIHTTIQIEPEGYVDRYR